MLLLFLPLDVVVDVVDDVLLPLFLLGAVGGCRVVIAGRRSAAVVWFAVHTQQHDMIANTNTNELRILHNIHP